MDYANISSFHITFTMSSTKIVLNINKFSNSPKFCSKNTKCLWTSLYNLELKLLLGLNFEIVITRCVFIITTFSTDIKLSNNSG